MENIGFDLVVPVPADEWAYCQRRVTYLEAVLVQVLRDRERVQEWYDAGELAGLRLPGLPNTRAGVTRMARAGLWRRREMKGRGGTRYEYHYSSLPGRAFDRLISRIVDVPEPKDESAPMVPEIAAAPVPAAIEPDNTAPAWVLPFMRLLRGGAHGDISAAWWALPMHLPAGVPLPSEQEAAEVIERLGLAKGF